VSEWGGTFLRFSVFLLLAVDDDAAGTEPGIFPVMEQLVRQVYFATELLLSSSEKKKKACC